MHHFEYKEGELHCEGVPLARIAGEVGTPAYVYSYATLERHYNIFDRSFEGLPHLVCFSAKCNSNISLLRMFSNFGGGVDIVSGGELYQSLEAGVPADRIVFSGVGKTKTEMLMALEADILVFNIESSQELDLLSETVRESGKTARISFRVNPDVDPKTHPYISTGLRENKFGIPIEKAVDEYRRAADLPGLEIIGLACHIGSQLTDTEPFVDAVTRLCGLIDRLKEHGINLKYLDLGGGLGITYDKEAPPQPGDYAKALNRVLAGRDLTLILEPGRVIAGNAGVLLATVLYTKDTEKKTFIVTDGAMNDLLRPALYNSFHAVQPVTLNERETITADVVGPICESSDFLAKERSISALEPGELLAVMSAGAYGFTMSSNYNSRRRSPEVLVRGDEYFVIRTRETFEDLVKGEQIPTFLESEN